MICNFTVGQKVVSIYHEWSNIWISTSGERRLLDSRFVAPAYGEVVKIKSIHALPSGDVVLLLHEYEGHWDYQGFRPLQDRPSEADTDISVFYPALNFTNHREKEPT